MERALVFSAIYFRVWNALWYFVLYFSVCVTGSGVVIFCVVFIFVWNTLWYFVLCSSSCRTRSSILCCIFSWFPLHFVLYYICLSIFDCRFLCYIFPRVEHTLVLSDLVLYFSACGTRSDVVESCVIFFRLFFVRVVCVLLKYKI